jgi:death-on-curing protein
VSVLAFSREEVLAIHTATIERFGGIDGLRDEGLLDSALAQPFQTFGGADLYPSVVDKACRYAFGIISDHPFLDGNKRTGAALLGTYLRMSGTDFKPAHAIFLKVILGVADGSVSFDVLVEWTKGVVR